MLVLLSLAVAELEEPEAVLPAVYRVYQRPRPAAFSQLKDIVDTEEGEVVGNPPQRVVALERPQQRSVQHKIDA